MSRPCHPSATGPWVVRRLAAAPALMLLAAGAAGAAVGQTQSLRLGNGQSQTVELPDMAESVDLSRADVVDVSRGANKAELVIRAKGHGAVDLAVKLKNGTTVGYQVTVSDPDAADRSLEQVRRLLGTLPGVSAAAQGGQLVLSGTVTDRAALQRIASVKARHPGLVIDGTDKSVPEPNLIVQSVNRILSENDIANIQAVAYGRLLVLEGSPKDGSERELALRIARMIRSDIEDRTSRTSSGAPPINIEVMFVEVQRRSHKEIGFHRQNGDAADPRGGPVLGRIKSEGAGGKSGRLAWTIGNLATFLSMIQTKTSSRVLANPRIVGRSGTEAEFHSGGVATFGTPAMESGVAVVHYKEIPYGVSLKVRPELDKIGQIDATLEANVAEFAATPVRHAIVDTTTTKLKTAVTLKNGQSIMLSGLVSRRNQKSVDKVPLLGDIPIVGELFKSRVTNDEDKELLILITMNRISGNDHAGDDARRLFDQAREDVEFSIFD